MSIARGLQASVGSANERTNERAKSENENEQKRTKKSKRQKKQRANESQSVDTKHYERGMYLQIQALFYFVLFCFMWCDSICFARGWVGDGASERRHAVGHDPL
jgi:hypothetical protein